MAIVPSWDGTKCVVKWDVALGSNEANYASSCLQTKEAGLATGVYYVKHPGHAAIRRVYCDNDWNGGGWELIFKVCLAQISLSLFPPPYPFHPSTHPPLSRTHAYYLQYMCV